MRQTNTQCWIRILGLPQEYWRPKILYSIARGIGVPLSLDDATKNKSLGHFARVLVDVDITSAIRNRIMVRREGFSFYVDIEFERLPFFCSLCRIIGHSMAEYRNSKNKKQKANENCVVISKKPVARYIPKKVVPKEPLEKGKTNPHVLNQERLNKGKEVLVENCLQANLVQLVGESSNPPPLLQA